MVEVELLAAGMLERRLDKAGRETLRVTDAGVALLAQTLQRNRAARDAHEALVARVALEMQRAGRVVWRGLSLRVAVMADAASKQAPAQAMPLAGPEPPVAPDAPEAPDAPDTPQAQFPRALAEAGGPTAWVMAMPDVFSIRHTTVEDYVEPIVHEIKVRRADLLSDVRQARKREAYLGLASQCWYVLQAGIGTADDVPDACGVMLAHAASLEVLRPAPRRPMRLSFGTWMALARAAADAAPDDDGQGRF
jgi:hypothetical protein